MLDLAHIRALWSGDAFQYLGSNKDLLAYTGHHHVVINSFGQPVIQTPDAASIVVEIGDWVFRHNGALHACAHEVWLVIAAARELVPAMADEIERLRRELDSERAELQRYRWMNHEERSVQSTPPPSGEAVRAQ